MRAIIAAAVIAGVVAVVVWWVLRSEPSRTEPTLLPNSVAADASRPQSRPVVLSPGSLAPRPFVEPTEPPESRIAVVSRPAVPAGEARLEIPVVEADGTPSAARAFDLVTTMGIKNAEELAQEESWIAMTIGSTTSGNPRVKATYAESGPNADGVATCEVPADQPGHLRIREAPAGPKQGSSIRQKIKWLAVIPFDAIPNGGTRRLDAIHLPSVPLLVGGRVETDDGRPVQGAFVRVGPTEALNGDRELVRAIEIIGARTAADGSFRVESDVTAPSGLLAWAHVEGSLASQVASFEPKQTDLVLKVRATGGLKGRIRVAPGLGEEEPNLDFEPMEPALGYSAFRGQWSPRPYLNVKKKTGELFREGIPAGTYRLFVGVSITRLMTIDNIVIEPGKINEDPRIADLVIGADLRIGVVRVVGADGKPVRGATVYWRAAEKGGAVRGGNTSHTNEMGESTLPLPENAVMTIRVEARGFRPWEGPQVTLPLVVKLDSGAKVTISLPGSRDWAKPAGIGEYLLCLLPETDVDAALKEGKNPIPSKIHQSQCQSMRPRTDDYTFEGTVPGRLVVFVVPRKFEVGRAVSFGEHTMLYGEEGLEIGRLNLEQGKAGESVVYRVDPDRLIKLALK